MRGIAALRLPSLAGQQQPFSSRVLLNVTLFGAKQIFIFCKLC
jgi:hypothetical protein